MVQAGEPNQFDLYDLNTASATAKPTSKGVAVPSDILAAGSTTTGWQLTQWSSDNRHVVLKRAYQKSGQTGAEYILFDRQEPSLSQNLSVVLGFTPTTLVLRDLAYDQYLAFDQNSGEVFSATLKKPTPQPYLSGVLAFAADHDLSIYVTAQGAPNGKVLIRLKRGDDAAQTLRQAPVNAAPANYLIALARYGDKPYVAAGSTSEGRVYVYEDPMATLTKQDKPLLVPAQILRLAGANYLTFSPNARFVMMENGDKFAVYDAETEKYYAYQAKITFDAPQTRVSWMDGFRLSLISNGKLTVFDFDGSNQHTLAAASPNYLPFFDRQYRFSYNLTAGNVLTSTPLLVTQDL
jgi:hypothetical protein